MDAPSSLDVERQMRLVLASSEFQAAPKLSELLYYIVTETLAGHAERLKGYTIGVDVFDRNPDFDQGLDAIVRVQMGRLRKLLASYYLGSGQNDPIRLILVPGRYTPRFELATGEDVSDVAVPHRPAPEEGAPPPAPPADTPPPPQPRGKRLADVPRPMLFAFGALLIALLAALTLLFMPGRTPFGADPAVARPQGPLVYVAQYDVIGDDPLAHRLAAGLQYDLIEQLSKFPDLGVLGIDSVSGTGQNAAAANLQGADFLLGGAIEVVEKSVRVTSQLKRARDGVIIWSDQALADSVRPVTIMALQADIATSVATKLGQAYGVIPQAMSKAMANEKTLNPSLAQYECVLSAYAYMRHKTADAHLAVRTCLEKTVAAAPNYATAWAVLSWIHGDEERYGFNRVPGQDGRMRALRAAERAVAADANNATAHEYLSVARFYLGNDDAGAREATETALRLSPNNSEVLADAAWTYALLDGSERARQLARKAIDLNPGHPSWYWGALAIHALQNGLKSEALEYARLNMSEFGPMSAYLMAGAYRLNGDIAQADAQLDRLARERPGAIKARSEMMRLQRIPPKLEKLIFGDWQPD